MSDAILVNTYPTVSNTSRPSTNDVENSGPIVTSDTNSSNEAVDKIVHKKHNGPTKNILSVESNRNNSDPIQDIINQENLSSQDILNTSNTSTENQKINETPQDEFVADQDDDDNASVLVIILQCETKPCDDNIMNLKWVFSDPYFTVQVCAVDPPPNVPITKTLTKAQYMENYCMRKALTYAAEGPYIPNSLGNLEPQSWWSNIPVIIVKDSSISNISSSGVTNEENIDNPENEIIGGMKRRIKVALDKAHQADLFFLCKWHDACNKYVDVEGLGSKNNGSTLKWSIQPTATQAIMYTPSSRDYIRESLTTSIAPLSDLLNTNISKGNLLATVFVPNVIDFDIDLATSNEDYNKLNECAPLPTASQTNTNVASFIWFAVIIILIILVAWALIQLSPQYISSPKS